MLLPLVLLGFSAAAVNAYVILVGVQAVLAHANLRLDFGWLEYVMVTPRYHHWHHARDAGYVDVELRDPPAAGRHADGHVQAPAVGEWPAEYGVNELETVPAVSGRRP